MCVCVCVYIYIYIYVCQISHSHVQLFVIPWTAAAGDGQASLSITNFRSLLKLMSIESVMPSNHLILYHPLLVLTSIFTKYLKVKKESSVD